MLRFLMALAVIGLAGLRAEADVEASSETDAAPQLRATVVVQGEVITLGDLFTNAGDAASFAVLAAPHPGKSLYVGTAQIASVVVKHALQWHIPTGVTRILVRRDGTRVPMETLTQSIESELRRRGVGDNLRVEVNSRKINLFVPLGGDTTVVVEGLDSRADSGNFIARIYLPGAEIGDQRVQIPGRVKIILEIPVLARHVPIGEEITEDDIAWAEVTEGRISRGLVKFPQDLIGQSPRRRIRPGAPIRFRDIQRPLLVTKGALVSMVVQTAYMTLSTMGKALDSGAAGDTVRVLNTDSRQVIQAVVDARDRVLIPTHGRMANNR